MWAEVSETWDNIARETKIAAETARLQAEILYFESEARVGATSAVVDDFKMPCQLIQYVPSFEIGPCSGWRRSKERSKTSDFRHSALLLALLAECTSHVRAGV